MGSKMKTLICSTCGCSLVRLGISPKKTVTRNYKNTDYSFCCDGCAILFDKDPIALLNETKDLVVCPSCLGEKPLNQTVSIIYKKEKIYFCRCPYCITVFKKNAEYFTKRLSGETEFSGVFSDGPGCCS